MEKINVFAGILNNYIFVGVLTATVLFQIVIIEFLGTFANTTPLTAGQWFVCILFGFLGMPIAAALKMISIWRMNKDVGKDNFVAYCLFPSAHVLLKLPLPEVWSCKSSSTIFCASFQTFARSLFLHSTVQTTFGYLRNWRNVIHWIDWLKTWFCWKLLLMLIDFVLHISCALDHRSYKGMWYGQSPSNPSLTSWLSHLWPILGNMSRLFL